LLSAAAREADRSGSIPKITGFATGI